MFVKNKTITCVWLPQNTLCLDPTDRYLIEECLNHQAFQTEQLLNRSHNIPIKYARTGSSKKRKKEFPDNNIDRWEAEYGGKSDTGKVL